MAGIGIGLALPFYQFLGAQGGSDPSKAIDEIIDAAGPSLYQFNDASTYDATVWPDSSGNGRTMLDVDQSPTTTTLFGRPALNFEGNSSIQRLQATAPATDYQPFVDQSARGIMYVVAKGDGVKASGDILNTALGSGWSGYRVLLSTTDTIIAQGYNGTSSFASPTADGIASGGFYKIQQGNGASQSLTYEGPGGNDTTATSTDGTPFIAATQTLSIGGYPNSSQSLQFAGDVSAFVLLLNPTPEQEAAVEEVLRREYLKQDAIQSLGPAVHLRADTGVTLNGSDVSAWEDQSGWGNDAVNAAPATQPLFSASVAALNGKPAVTIDAADKLLDTGSYNQGNLPTEAEFFSVGTKPSASIAANSFVFGGALPSTRGDLFYTVSGSDLRIAFFSGVSVSPVDAFSPDGSAYIANVNSDSGGSAISYRDASGEITATAGALTQQMSKLRVGEFTTNDGALVNTAEIIIFPRKLTDEERAQVLNYLNNKYSVSNGFWDDSAVWNDNDTWGD